MKKSLLQWYNHTITTILEYNINVVSRTCKNGNDSGKQYRSFIMVIILTVFTIERRVIATTMLGWGSSYVVIILFITSSLFLFIIK